MSSSKKGPRVLLIDIETFPLELWGWALFDQNFALNQIKTDWSVLSFSAKWLGDPPNKIIYHDQKNAKDIRDDKALVQKVWTLLDEADIVISQNGIRFDTKKLNARFVINKLQPPSSYKQIDTLVISKKHFSFTSNKLEYLTDKLCVKYKKLTQRKFAGFDLWKACMAGNNEAWKEMAHYNKYDVLSLEELYTKLIPWDNSIDFNLYNENHDDGPVCKCGSTNFIKRGYFYTSAGKYQRFRCNNCGAETRSKDNLFLKEKRKALRPGTVR